MRDPSPPETEDFVPPPPSVQCRLDILPQPPSVQHRLDILPPLPSVQHRLDILPPLPSVQHRLDILPPLPSVQCRHTNPSDGICPTATDNRFPVKQRPQLFLFLTGFLLIISFAFNAFFCAGLWCSDGTFPLAEGCSSLPFSNLQRKKRQIWSNDSELTTKYAVNKVPKHTEVGETYMPLFLPLYTQISQKYLFKICHQRLGKEFHLIGKYQEYLNDAEKNRTKQRKTLRAKSKGHGRRREKVCAPMLSLGAPCPLARRVHRRGSAMRRGGRWFLTEYDTGYSLFLFDLTNRGKNGTECAKTAIKKRRHQFMDKGDKSVDESDVQMDFPSQIVTLPEPFRGTDHSVGGAAMDETFFYQSGDRIQALHLRTRKRISKLIYAAKARQGIWLPNSGPGKSVATFRALSSLKYPLYGSTPSAAEKGHEDDLRGFSSASSMDLEVDQSALWVLFRRPNLSAPSAARSMPHLTVLKLTPDYLKELGQWDLGQTKTDQMVNAFVACGQLFGVIQTEGPQMAHKYVHSTSLHVAPLFNFRTGQILSKTALPISAPGWKASGPNSISNVQYDAVSDSLIVFDAGNVYTLKIRRKKPNEFGKRKTVDQQQKHTRT